MNRSGTFWALLRHEFKRKGSWRKQNRSPIAKWWWWSYLSLIVVAGIGTTTYFAIHSKLQLQNLWSVTLGFPYMMFFFGVGMLKREWENETHGWWLTLPYPRLWLVGAKWAAMWLRWMLLIVGVFLLGSLYVLCIAFSLSQYTLADAGSFMIAGINWVFLIAGFSPCILALGLLTAATQMSTLRPLNPILWAVTMGAGSFFYWGLNVFFPNNNIFQQISGNAPATWFPFPWSVPAGMVVSWLVACLIIRLCAYLLEKKLSL